MIAFGCDCLLEAPEALVGREYGLLAHSPSVSAKGEPLHLALGRMAAGSPKVLFGPEHGYWGVEQDMVGSANQVDPWTGIPILSLYGDDPTSLRPQPEAFEGLDLLVIDLQDIGSRYYTYAATALWAAEVALGAGLEVWVLDRPNPLGGERVEGPPLGAEYRSFVGAFHLPIRHGLTLGEMARLEAERRGWGSGLRIWTMEGWRRSMTWEAVGRPWVPPSPNMPTLAIAHLYPGLCLVEATELSEGRGTTRPFQLVGAPGLDGRALAEALNARVSASSTAGIDGFFALPTFFRPQFQKHAGEVCGGVELLVTDPTALSGARLGVTLLAAIRRLAPEALRWRREPYEFESERPALDLLSGNGTLREMLEQGQDPTEWVSSWSSYEASFREERRDILLYPEEVA